MAEKRQPVRTCIACREEFDKKDLLRIVRDKEGNMSVDVTGKANGRGAYICKNEGCLKKLKKAKLLDRVFAMAVSQEIYDAIEEELLEKQ